MIELHPFTRDDFARLVGWANSPEFLMQWAGPSFTYPLDEGQLEKYLREAEGEPPGRCIFKALEAASRNVVGHIELAAIDRRNRSARVSRVLIDPSMRGRGYGIHLDLKQKGAGIDHLAALW